ncbi:MAG: hypothetical protein KDK89_11755 [Alphaproteobacteria bacterium]|nr:hypothetical protein [Alphaproteobacteria bacterium]
MQATKKDLFAPRLGGTRAKIVLAVLAVVYAAASVAMQIEWTSSIAQYFPPIELAMWTALAVAVGLTAILAFRRGARGLMWRHWLLAAGTIATLAIIELGDAMVDRQETAASLDMRQLEYLAHAALAVTVASALLVLSRIQRGSRWMQIALAAIVAFQALAIVVEYSETLLPFGSSGGAGYVVFTAELAELLCIELYVVAIAIWGLKSRADVQRLIMRDRIADLPPEAIGAKMREIHRHGGYRQRFSHPPIRIAYVPVVKQFVLLLATAWLTAKAGPGVKQATGIPLWRQAWDMIGIWFSDGIDPPSYYQMELYRPERKSWAPEVLTRFETKNGMLSALNRMRPCPYPLSEMSHKQFFYQRCSEAGLPNPGVLAVVGDGHTRLMAPRTAFARDLFCKPERGMGAIGTMAFTCLAPDHYADASGKHCDLDGVLADIGRQSGGTPIIVQPWLRNHSGIADLANESLVTFRVVTSLGNGPAPVVVLAMLRVLAKLEPAWTEALDEEYASPIDLGSGRLGLFTGDNMATSCLRYERHPLTGAEIAGRMVPMWGAIKALAVQAHATFRHRTVVGWDIALTADGPVLLEGNGNLDVMFLQRVHDLPAGRTQFGVMLDQLLDTLVTTRVKAGHSDLDDRG